MFRLMIRDGTVRGLAVICRFVLMFMMMMRTSHSNLQILIEEIFRLFVWIKETRNKYPHQIEPAIFPIKAIH